MPTLYELADARLLLDQKLYESEGEVTPELEAALEHLNLSLDEKIEKVALYIQEQRLAADSIKQEEERLAKRRHAVVNTVDNLKSYLIRHMAAVDHPRVAGRLVTVALQDNPPSVSGEIPHLELALMAAASSPFVKVVPEQYVLDRRAVLDHVRAGNEPPPGLTVVRELSLRIR